MKFKDYYEIMGVERTATADQIKQAYRKLAHKFHPDISKDPQAEERFKEIGEAYKTLKDPEKRIAYDSLGQQKPGEQFAPPPDWGSQFNGGGGGFDDVDLADLFSHFGGGKRQGQAHFPRKGQDYEISVPVSLEDIFLGKEIDVNADLPDAAAHGLKMSSPHTFRVTLPKAAIDGQRLRLTGKGGAGTDGGKAGDLYVALSFKKHPVYRVDGRDLYLDLPLTPWESALGATVQIPTLAGKVELKIKAGTSAGQKLRLANRGLTISDGQSGALYAVVQIVMPPTLTETQRGLLEELAINCDFNPRSQLLKGASQ